MEGEESLFFLSIKPTISAKAHGHTSLWDYILDGE